MIGSIDARRAAPLASRSFHSLPTAQAVHCLVGAGIQPESAAEIAGQRPLPEGWLSDQRGPVGARRRSPHSPWHDRGQLSLNRRCHGAYPVNLSLLLLLAAGRAVARRHR